MSYYRKMCMKIFGKLFYIKYINIYIRFLYQIGK